MIGELSGDTADFLKELQRLTIKYLNNAGVAQLVEQLICNQQVRGAEPRTSSRKEVR